MATLTFALLLLVCAPYALPAQQEGTLSGRITAHADDAPVAGARIALRNTRYHAFTDGDGRFELSGVSTGTYTVVVEHPQFVSISQKNVTLRLGQSTELSLRLRALVLPVETVVASGITEPVASLRVPFTVGRVSAEQLQVPAGGSVMAALAGKVAGVSVNGRSGQLAPGLSIMLRSHSTAERLTPTVPLFVIDGVLQPFGTTDSDLLIEPSEIESIEVLKGPAASAGYGARGSAGVISITTRRGARVPLGQTRVVYRTEAALDRIGTEMPLSRRHWYRLSPDGTRFVDQNGTPVSWSQRTADPNHRFADFEYPGSLYDNVSAVLQPAAGLRHNATLAHHGQALTYALGVGRVDQDGELRGNTGDQRNQARINLDYRAGERASIALNGLYTDASYDDLAPFLSAYRSAQLYAPLIDLGQRVAGGQYVAWPDTSPIGPNPLWADNSVTNNTNRKHWQASVRAHVRPLNWLAVDANIGQYSLHDDQRQQRPWLFSNSTPTNEFTRLVADVSGRNAALGATVFGQLGALSGWSRLGAGKSQERIETSTLIGTDSVAVETEETLAEVRYRDYSLEAGADFADRYYFAAAARHDRSSAWNRDQRWQNHYRAGVSYRMSNEPWFHVPHVDEFVLRYAWGSANDLLMSISDASPSLFGNADLRPPRSQEHELGVGAVLLDHRLSLELTYALLRTTDQVQLLSTPPSSGFADFILANLGAQSHNTMEATIHARLINRPALVLDISAVGSRSRNRITQWQALCYAGETGNNCKGAQRGDIWGSRFARTTAELPTGLQSRRSEFQINDDGYLVWVGNGNTYRDGIAKQLWGTSVAYDGRTYRWGQPIIVFENGLPASAKLGSMLPDLSFGWGAALHWQRLSLLGEFRGQLGGQVHNDAKRLLYANLRHADIDQHNKPDALKKPIDYYNLLGTLYTRYQAQFVEDATYLKAAALSARFRFDRAHLRPLMGNLAPTSVSLGFTGRNLFTLTGYSGYDPEAGAPWLRRETLDYPAFRSFVATVDITF